MTKFQLPAEWAPQSAVLMAWPHGNSDWAYILDEVQLCFTNIIEAIVNYQKVLLVVPNCETAKFFSNKYGENIITVVLPTNDTWARDFGPISIVSGDECICLDFKFNGWGLKFASNLDNLITKGLFDNGIFSNKTSYQNRLNFVLEGGGIESDGEGTLLTTSECLLSPNRNGQWDKEQIEEYLKDNFAVKRVLWIDNGYLAGDDTDSHVDTLARLCPNDTIAYVKCSDSNDEHFNALLKMEQELKALRTINNNPYRLIELPMADEVIFDGERLPATYANFLIINNAVLVPTYNSPSNDKMAIEQLKKAFPNRDIIGIDCNALIKQHGSLHCVTMQLPLGMVE